jgi:type IV secretion system protein VirB10
MITRRSTDGGAGDAALRRIASLRPDVPIRRSIGAAWLFAGICGAASIGLFVALDVRRHATSAPNLEPRGRARAMFVDPPPLRMPPDPSPAMPDLVEPATPPPAPPPIAPPPVATSPLPPPPPLPRPGGQGAPPVVARMDEQAMVYDQSAGGGPAPGPVATAGGATAAGAPTASGGDDPPLRATVIRGRSTTIAQGSLIAATLETPIDSTRAGFVRAIVARDARGFDDSRILVPRGSRLIGEYASDVQSGQRRVLVTWTRLIRPDGVAIRLGSPATDRLGQAGIPGRADTHFLARFTSAVLQTALTIGTNLAARPGNGTVIVGVPGQATGSIGQLLSPGANLRPTIKVAQGAAVMVFVARDLDFAGATPRQ